MKKRLLVLITISALMASCGSTPAPSSETAIPSSSSEQQPTEMRRIYELYLADGGTMSYEQWLATIKGEPGKDGASIRHGQGTPDAALGNDGDSYLNMENWDYYLKTGGSWIKVGNIKGAQGEQGPQGEKGEPGDQGQQGEKGDKGDAGVSIVSIGKTGSDGLLDTYTITYSDGSASTFVVANGAKGEQGIQGVAGKDGHTPSVRIGANGNWFVDDVDTGIQAQGLKGDKGDAGADGQDGKSAYEIYKAAHSEYAGNEQQWLDDLVNGRLGTEEKVIYTVTFDLGYDDLSFTQKVEEGGKAAKPEDPTREGYNFMDWVDENQDHWVFNGYTITADMTLYAVWLEQAEYTVTLDANGGQCETTSLRVRGGSPFELPPASKEGYFFEGWYLDGNKVPDGIYTFASNVTLNAKWSKKYTITFDTNGGEPLNPITAHDTLINTLPTPVKNGCSFLGWSFDNNPISLPYANDGHEDMTLVARWREGASSDVSSEKDFVVSDNGDGTGTITRYLGSGGRVSIPSVINGLKIVDIGRSVFRADRTIKTVCIPGSIRGIHDEAFLGCYNLYSVEIQEGVKSIGKMVFSECSYLTNLSIPNSLTFIDENRFDYLPLIKTTSHGGAIYLGNENNKFVYLLKAESTSITSCEIPEGCKLIREQAFKNCASLSSLSIPNTISFVGDEAFSGCESLSGTRHNGAIYLGNENNRLLYLHKTESESITKCEIANGCRIIGNSVFNYHESLISVTIPDTVVGICSGAFFGCSSLATISIPNSVAYFGPAAFGLCRLLSAIHIPNGVPSIGRNAFENCESLTSVVIPDSVMSIGRNAFGGCTSLTSVTIPNSVSSLDYGAFQSCTSLVSIMIPKSVSSIGSYVLGNCTSLKNVFYAGTKLELDLVSGGNYLPQSSATIYFYSEERPVDTTSNCWHYVDDVPTPW